MAKYCNNRTCIDYMKPVGDHVKYCGQCSHPTVDKAEIEAPGSLVGGTANAVHTLNSNSNNVTHTTSNSNNTTIGTYSSGNVTNNTTIIVDRATAGQMSLDEKMQQYKRFCEESITNGIIKYDLRKKLDDKAEKLGLDMETRKLIENQRKERLVQSSYCLTDIDRIALANTAELIRTNAAISVLKGETSKLKPLAERSEDDEVHFYLYLLLAVTDPSGLIRSYIDKKTDSYWQSFWTYFAYLKNGNREKAETVRTELASWEEYSQDNITILYCCGELFASQPTGVTLNTLRRTLENCSCQSPLLEELCYAMSFLMSLGSGQRKLSNAPYVNFYLEKLWGIKHQTQNTATPATTVTTGGTPQRGGSTPTGSDRTTGPVIPTPPKPPVPNPPATNTNKNSNNFLLYAVVGIAAVGAFLYFRPEKAEVPQETAKVEQTTLAPVKKQPETKPTTTKTTTTKTKPTNTSSSTTTSTTTTTSTQTDPAPNVTYLPPNPSNKPASPKPASEMTPDEALSTGKSYLNKGEFSNAATYLKAAADRGSVAAQYEYAILLKDGSGIAKNTSAAFQYMKAAAEAGYTKAFRQVGEMYHGGRGVEKDRSMAEYWYKRAVASGDKAAERILNNM